MEIRRATRLTKDDVSGRDFSFEISAEVAKPYEALALGAEITTNPIAIAKKDFGFDESEFENTKEPDGVLFAVVEDERVYGYVHAAKCWNNMVEVRFIVLDVSIRGHGYGRKLLDKVVEWARQLGVAGIRLESQSNNVAACYFYRQYGFKFGGYDEYLYKGITQNKDETAFFWYYMLE
ncbi:acetyltransferase (GNAT) family domain-containing protein [Trichoderma breve]|uniref:Acetyltransferase (GNAT) family domain-containing protein n=1 Tax=Trichoderma breve TaxID=2034170 RepID=A0A9W9B484_9HYPO|nr:acetyltransferase (GNAT) family domain-containing protein [Trichoderma breve]KAJ4855848.1 acetyltransferase (GNAT) family domain-containing protein [Trichoderma breve]